MNLFNREMVAHRKSLIIWCLGVIVMVVSGMWKYGEVASSNEALYEMNELMSAMPKALQAFMGMGSIDLATVSGYYAIIFLYVLIMVAIHAVILGATIVSKEERDKTAEFLFTKPISRNKAIAIKLLVALMHIIVINVTTMVSSLASINYYGDGVSLTTELVLLMIGMFLFQLIFLTIGTATATVNKHPKSTVSVATAILLFTFILSFAIDMNDRLDWLKYATPFKYFEAKQVMVNGELAPVYIFLSIGIIINALIMSFIFYEKRDLYM